MNQVKTCLVCIGNELLSGKTVNTNLAYLGEELEKIGLPLSNSLVISDEENEIKTYLAKALEDNEVVITTGGLGPTSDDITKKSIAELLHKELVFHEEIWVNIVERFKRRGQIPAETNRTQAEVPEGFEILKNGLGTAPGLCYETEKGVLILLPGVPYEMKALFQNEVKPRLTHKFRRAAVISKTVHTIGVSESRLAEQVSYIEVPEWISLAFIPQPGRVSLRLTGIDYDRMEKIVGEYKKLLTDHIWGYDDDTLPSVIHRIFKEKGLTLSIAESCTGGLVLEKLIALPGASEFLKGGIVAYSNEAKVEQLGVKESTLLESGAVSVETAIEMAEGVARTFKTDVGISVTGVAGPDGGTAEKPVGTVCFGVCILRNKQSDVDVLSYSKSSYLIGNRDTIRESSAQNLLNFLRVCLKESGIV